MDGIIGIIMWILQMLNGIGLVPDSVMSKAQSVADVATSPAADTVTQSGLSWQMWAAIAIGCLIILAIMFIVALRLVVRMVMRQMKGV